MPQLLNNFDLYHDDALTKKINDRCSYGTIRINTFQESFCMSHEFWNLEEYQKQWKYAWSYFTRNKKTCFLVNIQPSTPHMIMWCLYKIKNSIHVQNYLIIPEITKKILQSQKLTPQNSFFHIPAYETIDEEGNPIAKWIITPTPKERKLLNI